MPESVVKIIVIGFSSLSLSHTHTCCHHKYLFAFSSSSEPDQFISLTVSSLVFDVSASKQKYDTHKALVHEKGYGRLSKIYAMLLLIIIDIFIEKNNFFISFNWISVRRIHSSLRRHLAHKRRAD